MADPPGEAGAHAGSNANGGARGAHSNKKNKMPLAAMRLIRHCRRHYKALFAQGRGGADAVGESDDSSG